MAKLLAEFERFSVRANAFIITACCLYLRGILLSNNIYSVNVDDFVYLLIMLYHLYVRFSAIKMA